MTGYYASKMAAEQDKPLPDSWANGARSITVVEGMMPCNGL